MAFIQYAKARTQSLNELESGDFVCFETTSSQELGWGIVHHNYSDGYNYIVCLNTGEGIYEGDISRIVETIPSKSAIITIDRS